MKRTFVAIVVLLISNVALGQTKPDRKIVPDISSEKYTEFAPTISADGRTLIFESDQNAEKGWGLMESQLTESGNWGEPVSIKAINDKCNFLAGPSLSYDGNTLYFTAFIEGVTQSEDIYYSQRLAGKNWTEPKRVEGPINTDESYEGFPSISADGNSLYFIRVNEKNSFDKRSKENCFVIYATHKNIDGSWREPEALPAPINLGCERDPRIMADNRTLIFSSIREGGKGKYDLYQSRRQTDGTWSQPAALDFINGADNDQSPCISASGDIMYFYSQKDIYSISIPIEYRQLINVTIKGKIISEENNKPLAAEVVVKNTETGEQFSSFSNAVDGDYNVILSAGQNYSVEFIHDQHVPQVHQFDLRKQDSFAAIPRDVVLKNTYKVRLSVIDNDIKSPVSAYVHVKSEEGNVIYEDSLRKDKSPLELTFQAPLHYMITATAKKYPEPSKVRWLFNPRTSKNEMEQRITLSYQRVKVTTEVTSITSNQKIKKTIYYNNNDVSEVIIADAGETVFLRKGDRYQVVTSSDKGYFFSSASIVAGEGESDGKDGFKLAMQVIAVEKGALLTLNQITFPSNAAELNASSFVELDRVLEFLKTNPHVSIAISAHTDDVGDDAYNLKLSERRALSVLRYLKNKGADVTKLITEGFGEKNPVVPNDSEENRAQNRRVELRVLKVQ